MNATKAPATTDDLAATMTRLGRQARGAGGELARATAAQKVAALQGGGCRNSCPPA